MLGFSLKIDLSAVLKSIMEVKSGPNLELLSVAGLYHNKILGKRLRLVLSVPPKKMIGQE